MVLVQLYSRTALDNLKLNLAVTSLNNLFNQRHGGILQRIQTRNVQGAHIDNELSLRADDVRANAGVEQADIERRFCVQTAITGKLAQSLCCQHNRIHAFLRRNACMSRLALDGYINIVQLRCSIGDFAWVAADIHAIAIISLNPGFVEINYAQAANLLADGEAQLHIAMRHAVLLQRADSLQHSSNANLVVTAKRGRAIAVEHAVLADNLRARRRRYRVHVCLEEQARCVRNVALHIRPNVAAVAAGLFVGLVHLRLQTKLAQLRHNQLRLFLLALAGAGNAYQLYKFVYQSVFVNQFSHLVK